MSCTTRVMHKTLHIIDRVWAGFLPTVADSPNVFFVIFPEEIDGAENIFVLNRGRKCRAASVVRPRPNLFLLSALRKRGDRLLPGRLGRLRLRGPYGGRKAARGRGDVLQDWDERLRRRHGGWEPKVGVGARVALGRSNLLYSASTMRSKCSIWELVFSNALTIFGHFTPSHPTVWQVSLLRLTLLDNASKSLFDRMDGLESRGETSSEGPYWQFSYRAIEWSTSAAHVDD
jgi:hypothetical protein